MSFYCSHTYGVRFLSGLCPKNKKGIKGKELIRLKIDFTIKPHFECTCKKGVKYIEILYKYRYRMNKMMYDYYEKCRCVQLCAILVHIGHKVLPGTWKDV